MLDKSQELDLIMKAIKHTMSTHIVKKNRGDEDVDASFVANRVDYFSSIVMDYLSKSENIIADTAYFIDFLKYISRSYINEGDSALFLITIIAWFNLKDYAKENMIRNRAVYMNDKLRTIINAYCILYPTTVMSNKSEELYNYTKVLDCVSIINNQYSVFNNYIERTLNTIMVLSIQYEQKRWEVIEERSMVSK